MTTKKTEEVVKYYNQYTTRQRNAGINQRHKSIMNKAVSLGLEPNHSVLEIGCGIGTLTQLLVEYLKYGMIYSVDISDESIRIAKEVLGYHENLKLEVYDATIFSLDKQFDVIILPDVLEHIPIEYHAQMFQNLSKMLKTEGFIYIHIPNPYYLEWCHCYSQKSLQIIDQPIYLETMLENMKNTDLYLFYEKTYSIWIQGGDYTHRVLRKKQPLTFDSFTPNIHNEYSNIFFKIINRFKLYFKNFNHNKI
jgi:cyclopropane fatty-acyl-phospholipid synthase-like methyltransferase